jgi:hypothetical protein
MIVSRAVCLAVIASVLVCAAWAASAASAESNAPVRLMLELTDGSRIAGAPARVELELRTAYATMRLPLERIASITLQDDHKTAALKLKNGDKLQGALLADTIELDTLVGKVQIGIEHVSRIMVSGAGALISDLILYYSFDEPGEIVPDKSPGRHDGKAISVDFANTEGGGGALDFSRSGKARVETELAELNGAGALTMAAWIKSFGDPKRWEVVVGGAPPEPCQAPCLLWLNARNLGNNAHASLVLRKENGEIDNVLLPFKKTVDWFHEDGWRHVAITWDGKELAGYVNGELDNKQATAGGKLVVERKILIGTGVGWNQIQHNFNGLITEVMVFKRALSPAEIKQIHEMRRK